MSNLPTVELDFDTIKEELITFLSSQSEFLDYDFTGSGLNTLIDVCAYLIHYVGVQANFALRESFLESAQLRKNVSAIAKELGYFPSQAKAGRASFTISCDIDDPVQPASLTVTKGVVFTSKLPDGSSIQFVTYADNPLVQQPQTIAQQGTNVYTWSGTVYVAQGTFVTREWEVTGTNDEFIIDQSNVDTDFLTIAVRASELATISNTWAYAKTITEIGPATEAYFLQENGDGIQVYFGNNVIGKALIGGQYITAEYLVTSGAISNGIRKFELTESIEGVPAASFSIDNVTPVSDGADRESMTSIRQLAPLSYARQQRIVTIEDYKTAVLENFPNIKAINAWGGEDAEPPEYGKVFVSVAPVYGDLVSPTTKKSIEEDILNKFSVVGITPEIIDPEYLRINLTTTVTYNKDKTTLNASDITTQVQNKVVQFFNEQVFDYEQSFKYSRFLAAVDNTHASIISSLADVVLGKAFVPAGNSAGTYEIKFYNALVPGSLTSVAYNNTGGNSVTFGDNGTGKVDFYINGSLTKSGVGTIDYATGLISLPSFNPNMASLAPIILRATPVSKDVRVAFNNLAQLSTNSVLVKDVRG